MQSPIKKKNSVRPWALPLGALILLISISLGLLFYRGTLQSNLSNANYDILENITAQQRFTFTSKLEDQRSVIQTYGDSLKDVANLSEEELLAKLKLIAKNSTFNYVSYTTLEGNVLSSTGAHLNIADRAYFQQALQGATVISEPVQSKVSGNGLITFATPIFQKGHIVAVMTGAYDTADLSKLLMPTFKGNGYTYITTSSGEIIVNAQIPNNLASYSDFFGVLKSLKDYELDDYNTIRAKIAQGESGYSRYVRDGEKRLMHYAPVGINDWYIFLVVPDSMIVPQAVNIMYHATWFMMVITMLVVLALIYFFGVQRRHMKELTKIAFEDDLTGLSNRKRFELAATGILSTAKVRYAFIIFDIDKFKVLNDTLGYECGNALLISIANILKHHARTDEFFGRCDSDEFLLLLQYTDDLAIKIRVQMIINEIERHFKQQFDSNYSLVICAGIYVISNPQESINSISDRARLAHKLVKGKGESGISFYDEEIRSQILEEKEIENKMHLALENNEFLLYLQPKYYLADESIYGAEALVRWQSREGTLIYPNQFIPLFEKDGFITKLDMYMLEKVCQTIRGWIDNGVTPIPISTNFSRLHLENPYFVDEIGAMVAKYQVPPELIEVELTESTMLDNEAVLIDMLGKLHAYGFTLSMDDFGSGYSSLGLLKNLPVDVIKLDRTFFVNYSELGRAITVISSMLTMARKLGIKTVAEGVETKEQVEFLSKLGCDIVQGYYYAKPMPALELDGHLGV